MKNSNTMTPSTIKAIIFDYGGVYMDSPFVALSEVAVEMGVSGQLLKQITFGDFYVDGNHAWHRLERGEIGLEQTRELILAEGRKHGLEADIYQMFARFASIEKCMRQELVQETLKWKERGYQLAIITNNIREFAGWRTSFPYDIETVFDVISDSSHLGIRKPNPLIYHHTLRELGVSPSEALFLDDHLPNVEAARKVGIDSYLVDSPIIEAIGWIESRLGKSG